MKKHIDLINQIIIFIEGALLYLYRGLIYHAGWAVIISTDGKKYIESKKALVDRTLAFVHQFIKEYIFIAILIIILLIVNNIVIKKCTKKELAYVITFVVLIANIILGIQIIKLF